ncbi:MAG: serine/threonine-protein kinase [Longimicrobiales bacterium]|nr:serine/threonine-protein kinase [Longimicrobiales bacterium]
MRSGRGDPDARRWERIEAICFEAMALEGQERSSLLSVRCAGDRDLRDRVEALLAALDRAPGFLEKPLVSLGGASPLPTRDRGAFELPEGTRVGRYRILRPLGHGGMGDVFLAAHEGDGFTRAVALKLVRKGLDTERVLERFRLERQILAGLRHPGIAPLLDGGVGPDGRPYFVMEFVEGEPIDAFCAQRDLSVRERLALVERVCDAVQHAHQNLVVHRDIKPANILVTADGRPRLLDFGIGKVLDPGGGGGEEVTQVEERALTPAYAAPEILRGETVTTAVDVFGLGVLLYRLLTDALPYPSTGTLPERLAALERPPRRPSLAAPPGRRIPTELDALVLKALAGRPEDRYGSAAALGDDLRRFREGRPVRARAPGVLYGARKFVGRHRVAVGAAAVALLSLAWGAGATLRQSRTVARERDRALEVRGFLLESFGAAGADRTVGDSVTARALLDGQAAAVREAYAHDPDLQAEMMLVLAEGYERLGLFPEALTWAERALDLRLSGPPGPRAAARGLVAWITHQQGRPDEALPLLEAAVEEARRDPDAQRSLARNLNDLGVVREALGQFDEAAAAHAEAITLRTDLFGRDHRSVAVSASNLSVIRYRQGDFAGAVREAERALGSMRAALGPDHQRAVIIQSNLAVFKLVAGDLQGAEDDFRDLWARQARVQGPEHPVTVRVMNSLASVLRQQEKWMEAESVLREVLRIMEGWEEPNPTELATTLANLGDAVSVRGGFSEAETLLRRALEMQISVLGPDHLDVADSQGFLSNVLERRGDLDAAILWQREAAGTVERVLGPGQEPTLSQSLELARLLTAADRAEEAGEVLRTVRERAQASLPADHPLLQEALRALTALGG